MDLSEWKARVERCRHRIFSLKHGLQSTGGSQIDVQKELDTLLHALVYTGVRGVDREERKSALRRECEALIVECNGLRISEGNRGGKNSIVQFQKDIIVRQDQALDEISDQLLRVSQIGVGLNDEVTLQNAFLDDIDAAVDVGNKRMNEITQKSKNVADKSGTGKYWLVIVLLIVVLIIVIAI